MARRAFALALPLLALALGAAACGEDEQETFRKGFRPLNQRIVGLGEDVATTIRGASGKSDKQIEKQFGQLAKRTGDLQQDVDTLEPPDDLGRDQEDLVEAMGDAQDALEDIEKAAADSDADAARQATIQLVSASDDLRDSRRKLARATAEPG